MADHNTREGRFRRDTGGVVVGAALAAFFLGPLMRFANPVLMGAGGTLLGFALFTVYQVYVVPTVHKAMHILAAFIAFLGLLALTLAFVSATRISYAVDETCTGLQRQMMGAKEAVVPSLKPGQAEPKDAFQALGCRPRTKDAL